MKVVLGFTALLHIYKFQSISAVVFSMAALFISIFDHTVTGVVVFPDLGARLNLNENALNSYFFFWTSILYLPPFFFVLTILIAFVVLKKSGIGYLLGAVILLMFYSVEFVDFQSANHLVEVFDTTQTSFNFLLTNNLNKYHPFIFYLSAILSFLTIFYVERNDWGYRLFTTSTTLSKVTFCGWSLVWINLFALYMGSWWALQEGTWGGWWNWDASEVFGLLFSLLSLRFLHTSTTLKTYFELHLWLRFMVVTLILVYFFIQLNFDLVSHNFGAKFFFFFSNNLFFIEIIFFGFIAIYELTRAAMNSYYQYRLLGFRATKIVNVEFRLRTWLVTLFYSVTFILMVNSFLPLLNYFWWNFFKVNLFNTEIYTKKWLIAVIFTLVLLTPPYSQTSSNFPYLYWFETPTLLIATILKSAQSWVSWLHLTLLSFFTINLISHDTSFIYFYTLDSSESFLFDNRLYYPLTTLLTCDNFEIAVSLSYFTPSDNTWISNYNLIYHANIPLVNSFTLLMNSETTLNMYHLAKNSLTTILYIETPLLSSLNLYTLVTFLIFGRFLLKR